MRYFAISAANFSTSTLVLQKQHRFKHKRRFSQVNTHEIRSKSFYAQTLSYDVFAKNASHDTQEIPLIE